MNLFIAMNARILFIEREALFKKYRIFLRIYFALNIIKI